MVNSGERSNGAFLKWFYLPVYHFFRGDLLGDHVHLSEEIKDMIGGMVTLEEIRDALWFMKPYKAPSPDGLHARFF